MTTKDKLEFIIQKTIENGWDTAGHAYHVIDKGNNNLLIQRIQGGKILISNWQTIIFNHEFAKSLFGEKDYIDKQQNIQFFGLPAWEYHLQNAVIDPDPINYTYESVKDD